MGAGAESLGGGSMVVPIYDENPWRLPHRPIITWGLIVLNILIYLAESGVVPVPDGMLTRLALTPATFLGNSVMPDLLGPVRSLLTYMFLHADWGHLLGNMIFLWVFGDDVEEALGRIRFVIFYLGCDAVYFKIKMVDIAALFFARKVKIRVTQLQQLIAKSRAVIFISIRPKVEPDIV